MSGYKNLELIARGGMGQVYKARHQSLNRIIVMEYLTGETLSQIIAKQGCLSLHESLPLLEDLASALDYAHQQGVIHRDIKPSNVIVEPITTLSAGRTQRAILMDFGIARFVSENTALTGSGDVLGTADNISPEQIHGTTELESRTDQYSFAVMTFQLLTGKKPFERNNTWAMIRSHLDEPPPDPRIHVPMPEHTAEAILRALAKKPEQRFSSVGEFVTELGKTQD